MKNVEPCSSQVGSLRNNRVFFVSEELVLMFIKSFIEFLEYTIFFPYFIARNVHISGYAHIGDIDTE